jgi:hypothetical protein
MYSFTTWIMELSNVAAQKYINSCKNRSPLTKGYASRQPTCRAADLRNLEALAAPSSGQYRAATAVMLAAIAASGASCQDSSSTLCCATPFSARNNIVLSISWSLDNITISQTQKLISIGLSCPSPSIIQSELLILTSNLGCKNPKF